MALTGPYATEAEAIEACGGPLWYCEGFPTYECYYTTGGPPGTGYTTEAECMETCGEEDTIESECCPGVAIPTTLLLTITSKTGSCSCLPDTIDLVHEEYAPGLFWWRSESTCTDTHFVFYCETDHWVFGTNQLDDSFFSGTATCDPFEYVYTSAGLETCDGSITATVTIP